MRDKYSKRALNLNKESVRPYIEKITALLK
jgi:hypothetical protein